MEYIQKTVAELEIDVQKFDFDRCHRIGKIYKSKGLTYQNVVLRLRSWSARDNIYKKRKYLPFKIEADLTTRRSELLDYAKDHVENDPRANEVAKFVFCDGNCKMKIFSKSEKFFAFSSEYEFLSIINRLDNEINYSEDAKKEETVKSSLLLHCIGEKTREIYHTLTFEEGDSMKYDKIIEKLEAYFAPRKNITYSRYKFLTYKQENGQSFSNYLTTMKKLCSDCELAGIENSLLGDMLVIGLSNRDYKNDY